MMRAVRYVWVMGWSWLFLCLERLWERLWAFAAVLALAAALAISGIIAAFGATAHMFLQIMLTGAAGYFLLRGLSGLRLPRRADVERAIEKESGLAHRPLDFLRDTPVRDTPDTRGIWHRARKAADAARARLKIRPPRPDVARQDPCGLRHAALMALVVALVMAQHDAWPRLQNNLRPAVTVNIAKVPAALDIWLEPPAYTGVPPVFLATATAGITPARDTVTVPAGSILKIRAGNLPSPPRVRFGDTRPALTAENGNSYTLTRTVQDSGRLSLRSGWFKPLGAWDIVAVPDAPPVLGIIATAPADRGMLKISYAASDDYGLTRLGGIVTPAEDAPPALQEIVYFDIPSTAAGDNLSYTVDLSGHPLAGMPAQLALTAQDAAGNVTESEAVAIVLPERVFNNPIAKRVAEERRRLLFHQDRITQRIVTDALVEIANTPAHYRGDHRTFLGLVVAIRRLGYDGDAESVASVAKLLWHLAVRIEDGGLTQTSQDLAEALDKLTAALNDKTTPQHVLQQLSAEVAQLMAEYMQQLAREMQQRMTQNGAQVSPDIAEKMMRHVDLNDLMEQLRQMQQGDSRDQMRKMAEFLKRAVQNTDVDRMAQMQQQQQKAMQALQGLQELIDAQQKLLDATHRQSPDADAHGMAAEQRRLRAGLGDIMRALAGVIPDIPEDFATADQEMKSSAGALARRDLPASAPHQKAALDALQKSMDSAMEQAAQSLRQTLLSFGMPPQGGTGEGYDPLGREQGGNKAPEDIRIPDEGERRRVQDIIRELRDRSNDYRRPKHERDYLDRLLDQFN